MSFNDELHHTSVWSFYFNLNSHLHPRLTGPLISWRTYDQFAPWEGHCWLTAWRHTIQIPSAEKILVQRIHRHACQQNDFTTIVNVLALLPEIWGQKTVVAIVCFSSADGSIWNSSSWRLSWKGLSSNQKL